MRTTSGRTDGLTLGHQTRGDPPGARGEWLLEAPVRWTPCVQLRAVVVGLAGGGARTQTHLIPRLGKLGEVSLVLELRNLI